jgi:hypothetical protein
MTIAEHLLADFRMEVEGTRKVLNAVPAERFDWQPHPKSMSLQRLAGHVAETPGWATAMIADEMDFAKVAGEWRPFLPASSRELMDGFERHVRDFEKLIAGRTDGFMSGTWTVSPRQPSCPPKRFPTPRARSPRRRWSSGSWRRSTSGRSGNAPAGTEL